jgi:hypothetical protein
MFIGGGLFFATIFKHETGIFVYESIYYSLMIATSDDISVLNSLALLADCG